MLAGHPLAQYHIGLCCERADGVPQDIALAKQWYERAAAQHNGAAEHRLGVILEADSQGKKLEALQHFEVAAASGIAAAQWSVGNYYECGDLVEQAIFSHYAGQHFSHCLTNILVIV